jgi:hypothetical protein
VVEREGPVGPELEAGRLVAREGAEYDGYLEERVAAVDDPAHRPSVLAYDPAVHHLVALSLLVFAAAIVSGLVVAGIRGLAAWRALKSFRRNAADGMLATAARIEQLEARAAASSGRAARLAEARAGLQQSLAEAAVIGEATHEVWALVERVRLLAPRN